MDMRVRKTIIIYGFFGVWALALLQFDDRKQPDIPAPSYHFDNLHISSEVAGTTTVDGISGDWFVR